MPYDKNNGMESEWNEASLKSRRLDEIQSLMNFLKMNLLGMTEGTHNYIQLLRSIDLLYGEGRSKYSDKEKESVDKLRDLAGNYLKFMPPHTPIQNSSLAETRMTYLFNQKNYEKLMDILYHFEMRVKDLNDQHGLTTKNKGTAGLF